MEVLFFWVAFTCLITYWAVTWDRSGIGFFCLSFFLSPLIAVLLLLIMGRKGKTCPKCGETDIRPNAQVCKHCGYQFPNNIGQLNG